MATFLDKLNSTEVFHKGAQLNNENKTHGSMYATTNTGSPVVQSTTTLPTVPKEGQPVSPSGETKAACAVLDAEMVTETVTETETEATPSGNETDATPSGNETDAEAENEEEVTYRGGGPLNPPPFDPFDPFDGGEGSPPSNGYDHTQFYDEDKEDKEDESPSDWQDDSDEGSNTREPANNAVLVQNPNPRRPRNEFLRYERKKEAAREEEFRKLSLEYKEYERTKVDDSMFGIFVNLEKPEKPKPKTRKKFKNRKNRENREKSKGYIIFSPCTADEAGKGADVGSGADAVVKPDAEHERTSHKPKRLHFLDELCCYGRVNVERLGLGLTLNPERIEALKHVGVAVTETSDGSWRVPFTLGKKQYSIQITGILMALQLFCQSDVPNAQRKFSSDLRRVTGWLHERLATPKGGWNEVHHALPLIRLLNIVVQIKGFVFDKVFAKYKEVLDAWSTSLGHDISRIVMQKEENGYNWTEHDIKTGELLILHFRVPLSNFMRTTVCNSNKQKVTLSAEKKFILVTRNPIKTGRYPFPDFGKKLFGSKTNCSTRLLDAVNAECIKVLKRCQNRKYVPFVGKISSDKKGRKIWIHLRRPDSQTLSESEKKDFEQLAHALDQHLTHNWFKPFDEKVQIKSGAKAVEAHAEAEAAEAAKAKAEAEAAAKAKAEAEAAARSEAEAKARAEAKAEAKAKAEAEAAARAEAEAKAKAEAEAAAKAKAEAEAMTRAEAVAAARAKEEAEASIIIQRAWLRFAKAKARAETVARAEAEAKAVDEAWRRYDEAMKNENRRAIRSLYLSLFNVGIIFGGMFLSRK